MKVDPKHIRLAHAILALLFVAAYAISEYRLGPQGKDDWIEGALLLVKYWSIIAIALLPITILVLIATWTDTAKSSTRWLHIILHTCIFANVVLAPQILLPLIHSVR